MRGKEKRDRIEGEEDDGEGTKGNEKGLKGSGKRGRKRGRKRGTREDSITKEE